MKAEKESKCHMPLFSFFFFLKFFSLLLFSLMGRTIIGKNLEPSTELMFNQIKAQYSWAVIKLKIIYTYICPIFGRRGIPPYIYVLAHVGVGLAYNCFFQASLSLERILKDWSSLAPQSHAFVLATVFLLLEL